MSRRSHEQLAMTSTRRRLARVRELLQQVAYDWYDSEIEAISSGADNVTRALDNYEDEIRELWKDFLERAA